MDRNIKELISQMTLEEKASLCSGSDFWNTKGIERLGIPSIMMTDGPHGLRKQLGHSDHLGLNDSVPATCFPSGAGLACSWDRILMEKIGVALGEECQSENISILLGPATNIKCSPLCGRNFEYFSEDPYLSSEMAANHIKGVQSQGKIVTFTLGKRAFAYYDVAIRGWKVENGDFEILIGSSSKDIALKAVVSVMSSIPATKVYTRNSTLRDLMADPAAAKIAEQLLKSLEGFMMNFDSKGYKLEQLPAFLHDMPLRGCISSGNGSITEEVLEKLLQKLNRI